MKYACVLNSKEGMIFMTKGEWLIIELGERMKSRGHIRIYAEDEIIELDNISDEDFDNIMRDYEYVKEYSGRWGSDSSNINPEQEERYS